MNLLNMFILILFCSFESFLKSYNEDLNRNRTLFLNKKKLKQNKNSKNKNYHIKIYKSEKLKNYFKHRKFHF